MYAPASQFLNAFLVGATMAFAVLGTTPGGLFALAQDKAEGEPPGGKIEARLSPTPEAPEKPADPQPVLTDAKSDAIVPPMVRKRPPPAPTSVPIVAVPEKAAKAPAPVAPKTKVKAAETAPPKDLKCAVGFKYDAKLLKCAKAAAQPAKAATDAAPVVKPQARAKP